MKCSANFAQPVGVIVDIIAIHKRRLTLVSLVRCDLAFGDRWGKQCDLDGQIGNMKYKKTNNRNPKVMSHKNIKESVTLIQF